jgi:hypothetical protein
MAGAALSLCPISTSAAQRNGRVVPQRTRAAGSGVLSRCFVTFNVPVARYFGRAGTTTMHFSNYIVLGLLIACMALAAAMVLPRRHFPPPRL